MSRDIEMPGHVVLSTAVASGLCLVQLMQTGYRTLFCCPPSLLFIGYVVSCYADKTDRAWSLPHPHPCPNSVSPSPQLAPAVVFVTIRYRQCTLTPFLSLCHFYIHFSFKIETMFKINVLSVGSSNNTDQSHTYRMLTVSRHCAGHRCPSGLWKLQFLALSQN